MGRRSALVLGAVLAVLGFLLVTAASSTRAHRRVDEPRKAALIDQIKARRSAVTDLDRSVRQLRDQVAGAERKSVQRTRSGRDENARDALLASAAGTVAMRGPALVIRLSDSSRPPPRGASDAGAYKIRDQ